MTSNFQLQNIARSYGIHNLNVIMNDELKTFKYETGYYIINLQDSYEGGSHWCSIIVEKNKALYFDSFGCVPSLQVEHWIKTNSKYKYVWNNRIIQDLNSDYCGYFSLGIIIYIIKDKTLSLYDAANEYINLFKSVKQNDKIIMNLFKKKFKILT